MNRDFARLTAARVAFKAHAAARLRGWIVRGEKREFDGDIADPAGDVLYYALVDATLSADPMASPNRDVIAAYLEAFDELDARATAIERARVLVQDRDDIAMLRSLL